MTVKKWFRLILIGTVESRMLAYPFDLRKIYLPTFSRRANGFGIVQAVVFVVNASPLIATEVAMLRFKSGSLAARKNSPSFDRDRDWTRKSLMLPRTQQAKQNLETLRNQMVIQVVGIFPNQRVQSNFASLIHGQTTLATRRERFLLFRRGISRRND
jgi:hypothetical protein